MEEYLQGFATLCCHKLQNIWTFLTSCFFISPDYYYPPLGQAGVVSGSRAENWQTLCGISWNGLQDPENVLINRPFYQLGHRVACRKEELSLIQRLNVSRVQKLWGALMCPHQHHKLVASATFAHAKSKKEQQALSATLPLWMFVRHGDVLGSGSSLERDVSEQAGHTDPLWRKRYLILWGLLPHVVLLNTNLVEIWFF